MDSASSKSKHVNLAPEAHERSDLWSDRKVERVVSSGIGSREIHVRVLKAAYEHDLMIGKVPGWHKGGR